MMRIGFSVACIVEIVVKGVTCWAGEPLAQAKAKIAQCIEKEGDEYVEARNSLLEHPEALDFLRGDSWKERWVKKICQGWMEHKALYERAMRGFEMGEIGARNSVSVGLPPALSSARNRSRAYGDKPVPLMVECLWKTGRNWRRYKAWRVLAVVEYLRRAGDASVLDPAIQVLLSPSSAQRQTPDPGSEYPRMDSSSRAFAELFDQMAPYFPVRILVKFGDHSTLTELKRLTNDPGTAKTSKGALNGAIRLLTGRLEGKRKPPPIDALELLDLYVECGDSTTLEKMRGV